MEIAHIVKKLELQPHPEGGYYRETYRAGGSIVKDALPPVFKGDRNYCTAIYFLLTKDNFSAFHRILQDELWHFYGGDSLEVHEITEQGSHVIHRVGSLEQGFHPQVLVNANSWFASRVAEGGNYSLVGCTVAPGFDFEDFELADKNALQATYPQHKKIIEALCR